MEQCQQGAAITVRVNGQVFLISQSRASNGLLSGHGNFRKVRIDDADAVIGAALRECLNDRKPGFHMPHMHKEKEAHQALMKAYREDRGIASDNVFYKDAKGISVNEYLDRIEFIALGPNGPVKGHPHVVLSSDSDDLKLSEAIRSTLKLCE